MEEEINLRPYIVALIRSWKWIVGMMLAPALVAFAVTSLIPPTYEAKTLIAITNSHQVVLASLITEDFDPRFSNVNQGTPPFRAYPEIAMSDELLQNVLAQISPPLDGIETLEDLRRKLEVEPGDDQSILHLLVRMEDPQEAMYLANLWSELFVAWANEIYGTSDSTQLHFFEDQLIEAEKQLQTAEQSLISFQSRNTATILENQLTALQLSQANYLASQLTIAQLLRDMEILQEQATSQPASNPVSFADQLTALSLQVKAFHAETAVPLQFQTDVSDALAFSSRGEQVAFLDSLMAVLTTKSNQMETLLAELEPKILALQQEKQTIEAEEGQLLRTRDVAQDTYTALIRKVTEERITAQDTSAGVKLASRSAVPKEPLSSGRLLSTIAGGFLGGVGGIFVVLLLSWWQKESGNSQN